MQKHRDSRDGNLIVRFSVYEDSLLDLEKDFHEPMYKHSSDEDLVDSDHHWFDKLEDEMESGKINLLNWIFK